MGTAFFGVVVSLVTIKRYEISESTSEAGSYWFESSRGYLTCIDVSHYSVSVYGRKSLFS